MPRKITPKCWLGLLEMALPLLRGPRTAFSLLLSLLPVLDPASPLEGFKGVLNAARGDTLARGLSSPRSEPLPGKLSY